MERPVVLLSGVRVGAEARLRSELHEVELVALPPARAGEKAPLLPGTAAAVVNLDGDPEAAFRLTRALAATGARVLVLGPTKDADLILRAMREGAKEFVLASDDDAIARGLRELLGPVRVAGGGAIYAVFPAKGGVGATTLATNLAGALQRTAARTCLVDLNVNMGDVLAFLDLPGGYSLADVVANMRRLDRDLLDSTLLRHASGVHVLAQSHRVEEADRVEPAAVTDVLGFLRRHYAAVVLDGLRSFDELTVAAIDASDLILLVVTQEVPAVRDARRCADLFRRLGAEGKLRLVVNRFQRGLDIGPEVVAETVGLPVAATIANDYPAVIQAVNRGQLLLDGAPRAQVTRDLGALVRLLGRAEAPPIAAARPSLLRRFFPARVSHAAE